MQIRNQPIAHPYDPNALNASTTVQKSELVGTAFSKLIRSMNAPLHAKQEDLVPSEEVQAAWSPQAIYQSMAMQVPSPTSTSRTVRGICWTDQTLAVFIGNGGEIPIDTEKTINWDSQGDQEITEAQIAELRMKYNLDHLSAQDYYNLLSDLTNMGVLSAEDCAGMHLASGSSGITFQPFAVGGEAGLFDGNLVQHLRDTLNQMLQNWDWLNSEEYDQVNLFGAEAKAEYRANLELDIRTRKNMLEIFQKLG